MREIISQRRMGTVKRRKHTHVVADDIVIVREGPFPPSVVVVIIVVQRLTKEILDSVSIFHSQYWFGI